MTTSTGRPRRRPTKADPIITLADLQKLAPDIDEAKAEAMIEDAIALATRIAPCVFKADADPVLVGYAKAILRSAILRWNDQGSGSLQMLGADVFTMRIDNRFPRRAGGFYDAEINELRKLCKAGTGAFSIDIAPDAGDAFPGPEPWQEFVDP